MILDNYSPPKRSDNWLAKIEGRVQFTFSLLQRKTLNGASFKTTDQLREAIEAFIQRHNQRARTLPLAKARSEGQSTPKMRLSIYATRH